MFAQSSLSVEQDTRAQFIDPLISLSNIKENLVTLRDFSEPHSQSKSYFKTQDSTLFSSSERHSQQQAARFLHPKQQSKFILVFELMSDTYISENRLRPDKLKQPWYQCNTRPNQGFIDACKPANLVYKARLTYHV